MPSYMYLFWAPKRILAAPRSAEEARASGERWHAWQEELREAGHEPTGAQLEMEGRCVTGGSVAEGTLHGDHVLGGHFIVKASSLDHATELAKGCPLIRAGGTVEVRPLVGR